MIPPASVGFEAGSFHEAFCSPVQYVHANNKCFKALVACLAVIIAIINLLCDYRKPKHSKYKIKIDFVNPIRQSPSVDRKDSPWRTSAAWSVRSMAEVSSPSICFIRVPAVDEGFNQIQQKLCVALH